MELEIPACVDTFGGVPGTTVPTVTTHRSETTVAAMNAPTPALLPSWRVERPERIERVSADALSR